MTKLLVSALVFLLGAHAWAFDPVGPPPKKTLEWTARYLSHVTFPRVDFEGTTISDAVDFAGHIEVPEKYRVKVKITAGADVLNRKFDLKKKDITQIELLGIIAEHAGMDLLIQPGVVSIVPRDKGFDSGK